MRKLLLLHLLGICLIGLGTQSGSAETFNRSMAMPMLANKASSCLDKTPTEVIKCLGNPDETTKNFDDVVWTYRFRDPKKTRFSYSAELILGKYGNRLLVDLVTISSIGLMPYSGSNVIKDAGLKLQGRPTFEKITRGFTDRMARDNTSTPLQVVYTRPLAGCALMVLEVDCQHPWGKKMNSATGAYEYYLRLTPTQAITGSLYRIRLLSQNGVKQRVGAGCRVYLERS
jgi:hypothetical protein